MYRAGCGSPFFYIPKRYIPRQSACRRVTPCFTVSRKPFAQYRISVVTVCAVAFFLTSPQENRMSIQFLGMIGHRLASEIIPASGTLFDKDYIAALPRP